MFGPMYTHLNLNNRLTKASKVRDTIRHGVVSQLQCTRHLTGCKADSIKSTALLSHEKISPWLTNWLAGVSKAKTGGLSRSQLSNPFVTLFVSLQAIINNRHFATDCVHFPICSTQPWPNLIGCSCRQKKSATMCTLMCWHNRNKL